MRSETNGLRAQTTTSPLSCKAGYAVVEVFSGKKKNAPSSRVCSLFKELIIRVEPVLSWLGGAGTKCWWPFLCGCVLGKPVS